MSGDINQNKYEREIAAQRNREPNPQESATYNNYNDDEDDLRDDKGQYYVEEPFDFFSSAMARDPFEDVLYQPRQRVVVHHRSENPDYLMRPNPRVVAGSSSHVRRIREPQGQQRVLVRQIPAHITRSCFAPNSHERIHFQVPRSSYHSTPARRASAPVALRRSFSSGSQPTHSSVRIARIRR